MYSVQVAMNIQTQQTKSSKKFTLSYYTTNTLPEGGIAYVSASRNNEHIDPVN